MTENTRLLVTWLVWGVSNRWRCSEWSEWTGRHTWLSHADKLLCCWPRVGPRAVSKWVAYLWSAKIRIGPLRLQAGCRRRRLRLNLTLVSLCLFCVVAHFFWLVNACFCCVRFCFSISGQEIGLGNAFVSDIATFVLKRDVKLQLTN